MKKGCGVYFPTSIPNIPVLETLLDWICPIRVSCETYVDILARHPPFSPYHWF